MKTLLLLLFLFLTASKICLADNFQFFINSGTQKTQTEYAVVTLMDTNYKVIITKKYTDKYGRVNLEARPGTYICKVVHKERVYTFRVSIDKSSHLKSLVINP